MLTVGGKTSSTPVMGGDFGGSYFNEGSTAVSIINSGSNGEGNGAVIVSSDGRIISGYCHG